MYGTATTSNEWDKFNYTDIYIYIFSRGGRAYRINLGLIKEKMGELKLQQCITINNQKAIQTFT